MTTSESAYPAPWPASPPLPGRLVPSARQWPKSELHNTMRPPTVIDVTVSDVAPDDMTLGEVARRLDRLETGEQLRFKALDDRMTVNLVTRDYYEGRHQVHSERITRLEQSEIRRLARWTQVWVAISAALVASVGSLVIVLVHVH
jgi:hypothetical protein